MILLMRAVSLRKCFSPPASFNQGCLPGAGLSFNLSSTASVTNCRKGMPRSAALDLARRKMASGISSVVFIRLILPYLWEHGQSRSEPLAPAASPNHQTFVLDDLADAQFVLQNRFINPSIVISRPELHDGSGALWPH